MSSPKAPVRVFFPCTGLGREARGFESFTRGAADALAADDRLNITVFAGARVPDRPYRSVPSFARTGSAARALGRLVGRGPYFAEQLSFFAAFVPHLIAGNPDLVYFSDVNLGNACWHWRRLSGQHFRLLYANGGATVRPYTRSDAVQHMATVYRDEALARGEAADRNWVCPHGLPIDRMLATPDTAALRKALDLPLDRQILLTVGVVDHSTKRLDYVIRELAALPSPRPLLVILGAWSSETTAMLALAAELLGANGFIWRTVSQVETGQWYAASDAFVLASLREGFGLAYVEALAQGLPVLAHDFPVSRELLGTFGHYGDFARPGVLSPMIAAALAEPRSELAREARHSWAYSRYSWDALRGPYAELLLRAATLATR